MVGGRDARLHTDESRGNKTGNNHTHYGLILESIDNRSIIGNICEQFGMEIMNYHASGRV